MSLSMLLLLDVYIEVCLLTGSSLTTLYGKNMSMLTTYLAGTSWPKINYLIKASSQ